MITTVYVCSAQNPTVLYLMSTAAGIPYKNNIEVGFSPTDFFYISAQKAHDMPAGCQPTDTPGVYTYTTPGGLPVDMKDNLQIDPDFCNNNNSATCYYNELCKNQDIAQNLNTMENQYSGADQRHSDTKVKYYWALQQVVNLSIGILGAIVYIYRNNI